MASRARDPRLRYGDVPNGRTLLEAYLLEPGEAQLAELIGLVLADQEAKAALSNDPFYENYPPVGELPLLSKDRVPLLSMPTGEVLSVARDFLFQNVLLVGPTGGGKTNQLRTILCSLLADSRTTVVAFDRKGDLVDCNTLASDSRVLVLRWVDLCIALLQPPPGVAVGSFVNTTVDLLARHLSLMASRRLMLETLHAVFSRIRRRGTWPTLDEWIDHISKSKIQGFRGAQYKEAALWALRSISLSLGPVINLVRSDLLDRVMSHKGCIVIQTDGLPPEMGSLLASVFINWAYETEARNSNVEAARTTPSSSSWTTPYR